MSCGRWTRSEIFLSNSFLAAAEVTDLSYLTCHRFDRNGLVQAVATTGIQKNIASKASILLGRVSSRWAAVRVQREAWQLWAAQPSLLQLCFLEVGEDPAGAAESWLCSELGFLFSAFSTGMDVLVFLRGLPEWLRQPLPCCWKGFEGNEAAALCLMWGILSSLLKYAVLQCCCPKEKKLPENFSPALG